MTDDADAAARVIERLLVDPAFRADFRRDPATACSNAGLHELADYMAQGSGKALHTLEIRESRSSLAGVMMAAALEGVGVFEFAKHIVPGAAAASGEARDVLSRVNLPAVDGLRGSLAPSSQPPADGASENTPDAASPAASNAAISMPAVAGPAPAVAREAEPAPRAPARGPSLAPDEPAGRAAANANPAPSADFPRAAAVEPSGASAPRTDAQGNAGQVKPQASAAEPEPATSRAPIDPGQFGIGGTGGTPSPEALALLDNKNVVLDNNGVADIKQGRIDPRVVAMLSKLAEDHKLTISSTSSDHPKNTTGGSVSNHYVGRGIDIAAIDGLPVNAGNAIARDVAGALSELDPSYRPSEIGTPWAISGPGYFTDAGHQDHLHIAFDEAIDRSWTPPTNQAAASPAAPAVAATPAEAPSGVAGTLAIAIAQDANARKADGGTLGLKIPDVRSVANAAPPAAAVAPPDAPSTTPAATAPPDAASAPASASEESLVAGSAGQPAAGAKALAALEEALKYKGTPYLWGGSNPQTGFDCSGLTQWAYAKQGIETGRTTYDQIDHPNGTKVDRDDLLPGDLVFFADPSGDVHHMGMSMGGDKFLHAPRTGDVVKISSLDEPYYDAQFTGARRFDDSAPSSPAASPAPEAVKAASAALARDAVAARTPNSMIFKALSKQEASYHRSTVQFMRAIKPEEAAQARVAAAAEPVDPAVVSGPADYPGDDAGKAKLAAWLAAKAQKAGLPPELPVMAALVESGVANLKGGDADSVGFFQMRVGIWNKGEYAGYPERPELQAKWFIDHAVALKKMRIAAGDADFGRDPSSWGTWIADVERPAEQYRGRYQMRLEEARALLGRR
jgi:cell wall-associated NlpC family hydrolase